MPPGATRPSFASRDLRHRTLDGHSFTLCDFRGADLRGASLRGVSFAGCDLRDADLRDTDLSYARFSYVLTHDPEYGHTDVTRARWNGATFEASPPSVSSGGRTDLLGIRGYVRLTLDQPTWHRVHPPVRATPASHLHPPQPRQAPHWRTPLTTPVTGPSCATSGIAGQSACPHVLAVHRTEQLPWATASINN